MEVVEHASEKLIARRQQDMEDAIQAGLYLSSKVPLYQYLHLNYT
jgi:hypothetical protein